MGLTEIDGNDIEPIIVPSGQPVGDKFDYSCYPYEDAGTPALMDHHQQQLTKFGVRFGQGGFSAFDLHNLDSSFLITTASRGQYNGTFDGCIAPFGMYITSAGRNSVVVFVHKQSNTQKRAYCKKHPIMPEVTHHALNLSFVTAYQLTSPGNALDH